MDSLDDSVVSACSATVVVIVAAVVIGADVAVDVDVDVDVDLDVDVNVDVDVDVVVVVESGSTVGEVFVVEESVVDAIEGPIFEPVGDCEDTVSDV